MLAGRLWKFTYVDTSALGYFKATLAREGVLFNIIKSSYASPVSILTAILFEDLSFCAHLPVHFYYLFLPEKCIFYQKNDKLQIIKFNKQSIVRD